MHTKTIQFDSVADIYDTYVRADFDIPFWLSESKSLKGKVLELACGTGRVSIPLLKAGVDLSCVDYAPGMLARFREKLVECNLSCPISCQDMAELELPGRFDLIFIPFHSFSEITQDARRRAALERIRAHMTEQGIFVCTLQNPPVRSASMDGLFRPIGEFPMPGGGKLVVGSRLAFEPSTQLAQGEQVYDLFSPDGSLIDHRSLEVSFYLFCRAEFESFVHDLGFEATALYGNYDRSPFEEQSSPFMIWKLSKREAGPR